MKLKSRRDVVNETSSPNLSQKCSYKYLHWLVVHFAISIVQFNIILFQFKDANHHCLWRKPWRPIQMIQKWSKRTHNCSEFCQDPPESSGRWECPDIRRSVHENPMMSTNSSWSPTMCYLSSKSSQTLQFCFCSDSCLTYGRSCSSLKSNHHQDDSQKTHWRWNETLIVKSFKYLFVVIVSALN